MYKNHGIHRSKANIKAIFKDKLVHSEIDKWFTTISKGNEAQLLHIPEVLFVLSHAIIFDVIFTMGYKIDIIFIREFEQLAQGDYKFVLDQCGVFFNILFNNILLSSNGDK